MKTIRIFNIRILSAVAAVGLLIGGFQGEIHAQVRAEGVTVTIDGVVELDRTVYDFGDVMLSDGPLKCAFNVRNISDNPIAIYNVATSCGCTDVKWTREPIASGKSGRIEVTYSNNEGPYPFDKTLTVYISDVKKPVILRLRGSAHDRKKKTEELYPSRIGDLGFKATEIQGGNLSQGSQRSDAIKVVNLGKAPATVTFPSPDKGIKAVISPNPLKAGAIGTITYTITSDRSLWGRNAYRLPIAINGKKMGKGLTVTAFTKEDFSGLSKEERDRAAQPAFKASSYSFGKVKAGTEVEAVYTLANTGKSPLIIYKADSDWPKTSAESLPAIAPGKSLDFKVRINTTGMPKGETIVIVTLTTNSPLRPIVNLFIAGAIV